MLLLACAPAETLCQGPGTDSMFCQQLTFGAGSASIGPGGYVVTGALWTVGLTRSMMPYSLACQGSKYLGRWMSFAIFSGSLLVCRAISETCG